MLIILQHQRLYLLVRTTLKMFTITQLELSCAAYHLEDTVNDSRDST